MARRKRRAPLMHQYKSRRRKLPKKILEARAGRAMVRAIRAFNQAFGLIQQLQD